MNLSLKLFGAVLLVGVGIAFAIQGVSGPESETGFTVVSKETADKLEVIRCSLGGESFDLEVADDLAATKKGLGGRESIPAGTGMLFIDSTVKIQSYWMLGCLTDMDIAFVAPNGLIRATYTMAKEAPRGANEPEAVFHARLKRYSSNLPAKYAIETPAGTNKRLKLKPGEKIELDWRAIDKLLED